MLYDVLFVDEIKKLYNHIDPNIRIEYNMPLFKAMFAVHRLLPHISIPEIYLALKGLVIKELEATNDSD